MKIAMLPIGAALVLLAACNRQPPETPVTTPAETPAATEAASEPGTTSPAGTLPAPVQTTEPVNVASNAVVVGSAAGPSGAAVSPKPAYSLTDTVYASTSSAGRQGSIARVYWTYQDGRAQKEEEKPVTGAVLTFQFDQGDGMRAGDYTVEIDIDDVPVGITDFKVQ